MTRLDDVEQADRDNINLWLNNKPVCPSCGEEMSDAWEMDMNDGDCEEVECGHCGKPYEVVCCVSFEYTTRRRAVRRRAETWLQLRHRKSQRL